MSDIADYILAFEQQSEISQLRTIFPYDLPPRWAAVVHAHPQKGIDGMLYVSRQLDNRKAIVIFERAKPKLGLPTYEGSGNRDR